MARKPLVVSINIPFCTHRCSFCSAPIHTGAPTADNPRKGDFAYRGAYLAAVGRELQSIAPDLSEHAVQAVMLTGGIPTSCSGDELGRLVRLLKRTLNWGDCDPKGVQATLQTVPGMLSADTFDTLRGLGFRRYEFGMGTFNHFEYELLDRPTTRDAIHNMRVLVGYAGIDDIGVRLYWGIPGQTKATLRSSIDEALDNDVTHIRLEPLPLAPDTPLYRHLTAPEATHAARASAGKSKPPLLTENDRAELRSFAEGYLAKVGMPLYASSPDGSACFARPGHENRFDQLLAQGCDYVTLGLGGTSLVDGLHTVNISDLARYLAGSHDPAQVVATVEDTALVSGDRAVGCREER